MPVILKNKKFIVDKKRFILCKMNNFMLNTAKKNFIHNIFIKRILYLFTSGFFCYLSHLIFIENS